MTNLLKQISSGSFSKIRQVRIKLLKSKITLNWIYFYGLIYTHFDIFDNGDIFLLFSLPSKLCGVCITNICTAAILNYSITLNWDLFNLLGSHQKHIEWYPTIKGEDVEIIILIITVNFKVVTTSYYFLERVGERIPQKRIIRKQERSL